MNNRIKEVREYFKLSQGEFGQRIGLANSGISRIENGRNGTTDQNIKSICREFGVSEEWLRTGEGSMLDDTKPSLLTRLCEEKHLSPHEQLLISTFLDLPPQERAAITRYIDCIASHLKDVSNTTPL